MSDTTTDTKAEALIIEEARQSYWLEEIAEMYSDIGTAVQEGTTGHCEEHANVAWLERVVKDAIPRPQPDTVSVSQHAHQRVLSLLEAVAKEDPMGDAADAVCTCDVWAKEAIELLQLLKEGED
jgi:hypothetical protein